MKVLCKGLSFCPTPMTDWFSLDLDLRRFFRKLRLKAYFSDVTSSSSVDAPTVSVTDKAAFTLQDTGLYNKSTFQQPNNVHAIETYVGLVNRDVQKLRSSHTNVRYHNNLNYVERQALSGLSLDRSITIKPADKGGAVVVMDSVKYEQEIYRQLNDTTVYELLTCNPTDNYQTELRSILNEALYEGNIDLALSKYLYIHHPNTPTIYILPKIHKHLTEPPGRPIVSGRNSMFNHISIFLDYILREYSTSNCCYVKDTSDFLIKLRSIPCHENTILATLDVTALYTSISHELGLEAVRQKMSSALVSIECEHVVLTLLEFVLTKSYFSFCGRFYRQCQGTAMGANMAPSYANIYMGIFEDLFVYTSAYWPQAVSWLRYIDDIFVVWSGSVEELLLFHQELNSIRPELQFTLKYSNSSIEFLDVTIIKTSTGFSTDLHVKPTDRNSLLEYSSFHPKTTIDSLPWSQLLRVRRVTNDAYVETRITEMCKKFLDRGYPTNLVTEKMERARVLSQDELLIPKSRTNKNERIPFVSTFTTISRQVSSILRRHWPLLQLAPQAIAFRERPIMSYKRCTSLRDKLVRSTYEKTISRTSKTFLSVGTGSYPCLGCSSCSKMIKGCIYDVVMAPKKSTLHRIVMRTNCQFLYIIYMRFFGGILVEVSASPEY
ncbi:uncharacterized protein [Eleutherodactylus coqui]|uniref:uncharacterized protein n=1 Tax=Eleutherodactylus coqui TaxID=57060 RepID=UPI0034620FF7